MADRTKVRVFEANQICFDYSENYAYKKNHINIFRR